MDSRPWDPPMLRFDETGTHCPRCGSDTGGSLHSLDVPVSAIAGITHAFPGLSGQPDQITASVSPVVHTDPDECVTGRPGYDAHTRSTLRFGNEPKRPFPSGGPIVSKRMCPRQGKNPHEVGLLH